MMFRLGEWQPAKLLLAWCVYWLALLLVAVGPALPTLWRVSRPGAQGSASVSFGDGVLKLIVTDGAATAWTRDIGLAVILSCIAVPPLLLWALWLRSHRSRRSVASTKARSS